MEIERKIKEVLKEFDVEVSSERKVHLFYDNGNDLIDFFKEFLSKFNLLNEEKKNKNGS